MKEQKSIERSALRDTFNQTKAYNERQWANNGTLEVLELLSETISDLQACGINVSLELSSASHDVISRRVIENDKRITQVKTACTGTLTVNNTEFLCGLAEEEDYISVLKFYVCKNDSTSTVYDFKYNENALYNLQLDIISHAARNEIIRDHDVRQVFKNDKLQRLNKPFLKKPSNA